MHKWLAIVGLFVLVGVAAGQKPVSDPPKARIAKQEAGKEGQEKPESKPADQPTPPPEATSPKPSAPTCDEACQQGRENLKIQNHLARLTFGLVVVGFLQVGSMIWQAILLWKTRSDVHTQAKWMITQAGHMSRQADLMEKQLTEMQSGAAVAKESADAARVTAKATAVAAVAAETSAKAAADQIKMMKDKERARLTINPVDRSFWDYLKSSNPVKKPTVEIKHFGITDAFQVRGYYSIQQSSTIEHPFESNMWTSIDITPTIKAGSEPYTSELLYIFPAVDFWAVCARQTYLVFFGFLVFVDTFGDEHRESFDYYWFVDPEDEDIASSEQGKWERCDSEPYQRISKDLKGVFPAEPPNPN